ncbi:MAG: MBL fold metallo-hydrolase [Patescibacteria group bacterium]
MPKVNILIKGYVSEKSDDTSCCTITLVQDGKNKMVVDPGTAKSQKLIVNALKIHNLKPKDITHVCITHSHMDHYRNIGMFPNAKALDYWGLWDGDKLTEQKSQFAKNIKIIKTPGHNYDGITLLVKTTQGIIAICGDVFWKKDYPKADPYASNKLKLVQSRAKVLKLADFIIPGHNDIYKP